MPLSWKTVRGDEPLNSNRKMTKHLAEGLQDLVTPHLTKKKNRFLHSFRSLSRAGRSVLILTLVFAAWPKVLFSGKVEEALEQLKKSVPRFAEVSPGIYRSGRLHEEAAPLLKDLGIKTVLNLDDEAPYAKREEEFLKLFGIYMVWIPWNGLDQPKDEVIEKSLTILNTPELRPVLIHCERGSERTGVTIGCWRIRQEQWTAARAYDEMKRYEFRSFWYGHLKKYLARYARRHGDPQAKGGNVLERMKSSLLSFFYRFRKLNPMVIYIRPA